MAVEYRVEAVPEPLAVRRNEFTDQISGDYETKRDESYPLLLEKYESLSEERFGHQFKKNVKHI